MVGRLFENFLKIIFVDVTLSWCYLWWLNFPEKKGKNVLLPLSPVGLKNLHDEIQNCKKEQYDHRKVYATGETV